MRTELSGQNVQTENYFWPLSEYQVNSQRRQYQITNAMPVTLTTEWLAGWLAIEKWSLPVRFVPMSIVEYLNDN